MKNLVEVQGLTVAYRVAREGLFGNTWLRAVDRVSLTVREGESLGIAGETGSGKTSLARAIAMLEPAHEGSIIVDGHIVTGASVRELRELRPQVQMVFQDSAGSLDPRRRVGVSVAEPLRVSRAFRSKLAERRVVVDLFSAVGLDSSLMSSYPHEMSGGQRQRIGIARAISTHPRLVVCDEPTSGLDVSAQGHVVNLLRDIGGEWQITYAIVSHSLAILRLLCDRIVVLYCGKVMEAGPTRDLCEFPKHPYSKLLVAASLDRSAKESDSAEGHIARLGDMPSPLDPPSGCRFRQQCPLYAELGGPEVCVTTEPPLASHGAGREVACHFAEAD